MKDPLEAFAEVFADEIAAFNALTPEQIDAMAEDYAREQMDTAESEAAFAAMQKEYKR